MREGPAQSAVLEDMLRFLRLDGWFAVLTDRSGAKRDQAPVTFLDVLIRENILWASPPSHWLHKLDGLSRPVAMELDVAGIYVGVSPLQWNREMLYVWTCEGLERQAKRRLIDCLEERGDPSGEWRAAVEAAPELPAADKDKLQRQLDRWARLARIVAESRSEGSLQDGPYVEILLKAAERWRDGHLETAPFLSQFLRDAGDTAFGGFAQAVEEGGAFRIAETVNPRHGRMVGAEFRLGEGFLGQAAMIGETLSWGDIRHDPRSRFFAPFGIEPRSLICVPVSDGRQAVGLLFWGSCAGDGELPAVTAPAQALAALYGAYHSAAELAKAYQKQKIYLSSLIEITKLVQMIPDLKGLLAMLVDISLNLVEHARSSLLLFVLPGKGKASIVSRGLAEEQAQEYGRALISRFIDSPAPPDRPVQGDPLWGGKSIECPVVTRGQVRGVLCVSLPGNRNFEEYSDVFQALMTLVSAAIESAASREAVPETDREVTLLHESMGQWDPERHARNAQAGQLAAEFADTLPPEAGTVSLVSSACLVCSYSAEFLRTFLNDRAEIADLVEEFQRFRKAGASAGSGSCSTACQIMLLTFAHLEGNGRPEAAERLGAVAEPLRESFQRFLNGRITAAFETRIGPEPESGVPSLPLADLMEPYKLSSRELEVYALMAQGRNNREIAEALYISDNTVKNHITKLFHKLNVSDRAQAIALAYRSHFD
ncbi:helix-turn-helix transcriptional regulator [Cohnella caldifontis]|uniref:helix-turn-helix transcriptional regulator n=1 Tax=Cohnella caldifontis TaxID=3027471 RepID=UPI0023EBB5F9|nr:LuxR C-terminal-related transcriptional regulator [Cohnella sp. YIM B05605]